MASGRVRGQFYALIRRVRRASIVVGARLSSPDLLLALRPTRPRGRVGNGNRSGVGKTSPKFAF